MDTKKTISFLLACVMSAGMTGTAFADEHIKISFPPAAICEVCKEEGVTWQEIHNGKVPYFKIDENMYPVKEIYGVDSIRGYTTAFEIDGVDGYWVGKGKASPSNNICPEHVVQLLAEMGEVSATQSVDTSTGNADVPIVVTRDAPTFNVTVPTAMPISVSADGTVTTAGNVAIENNSSRSVCVKSVTINAAADWTLDKFDKTAMAKEPIDSKKIGFSLTMGTQTAATTKAGQTETIGTYTTSDIIIQNGSQLPITYDGTIPAQVSGIAADTQAASVVFTVDWAA